MKIEKKCGSDPEKTSVCTILQIDRFFCNTEIGTIRM